MLHVKRCGHKNDHGSRSLGSARREPFRRPSMSDQPPLLPSLCNPNQPSTPSPFQPSLEGEV
ncbi:hypothetical protein AUEXF2481DRAFT_37885, partial [Aureobasidium subglaciale EXF-2481]